MEKTRASSFHQGIKPEPGDYGGQKSEPGMKLFFDTSALVKRYFNEPGSDDVMSLCAVAGDVAVSAVLPVEIISTLTRLRRERRLDSILFNQIKNAFYSDLADMTVILLSPQVISHAVAAVETMPLKALDALHIGCALEYKPDLFVSGDTQQLFAAKNAGLQVKQLAME